MRTKCYLIFKATGTVRATRRYPNLAADEVAVPIVVAIPNEAFARFAQEVTLNVFESAVIRPSVQVEVEESSNE